MTKKVGIIGAGPGGYVAAIKLAKLGAEVILIEKDRVGGTCLNRGCIPTKTYFKTAEVIHNIRKSEDYGIFGDLKPEVDGEKLQNRKKEVVDKLVSGIEQLLKSYDNIKVYNGLGTLIDNKTIEIKGEEDRVEVNFDAIILANGSKPQLPQLEGIDLENVITSDELLELTHIPKSLVVVGGGVIGLEFASIYQELGSEVTVLSSRILKNADGEISKRILPLLKKQGMKVHNDFRGKSITKEGEILKVVANHKTKDKEVEVEGEYVLIAGGRGPVYEGLDLEKLGLKGDKSGIEVDENFQTSLEGVYAIGDIVKGNPQLAHVASAQGEFVAELIMDKKPEINLKDYPSAVFTLDEVAHVGLSEEELKEENIEYLSSKFNFVANGKSLCDGNTNGFVKFLSSPEGDILGVHILGSHANDLIAEATLAMANNLKIQDIMNTIHAHPTLSEAVVESASGIFGMAIHMANQRKKKQ